MVLLQTTAVSDWGDALTTAFADALALLLAGIPRILAFLVILVIGWFIAGLIARLVDRLLEAVRFDAVAQRSGFSGFVQKTGVRADASSFIGLIVKWFLRLIVLVAAFDALGLPAVSQVLEDLLLWLPNLLVALVILVIAGLAANALSALVRGATAQAGLGSPDLLSSITKVAVWVFGIVVAVNQIGIATTLVNTLFMGFVGALALALGLAFGLGGRETAGEIVRTWYRRSQEAGPRMREAARVAQQEVRSPDPEPGQGRFGAAPVDRPRS